MSNDTTVRDEDGCKVIPLKEPLKEGSKTITELRLRRPKAGDLRALDTATGEVGRVLALAASLSGEFEKVLDRLGIEDFMTLNQVLDGFLPSGLGTGPAS